ncbi:SHUGOSHIN 2 isoform X2 [Euphorbia lathyris]|uniref:SHUGOSHIN 2 isoform X2 n=1 Tax=Euphorbia lathyris TaxID=212925 RepID=UPI0033142FDB
MDGIIALDTENDVAGNRIKGEEVAKGSTVGNMPRKRLADISNLPQPNHDLRLQAYSPNTKEYIHKLHQENVSLHKLLAERTKIIQLQVIELQKFRTICQQVQQKNLHLAQTNSQMLEELNSVKDRLKVLQHELGCKNGLLTARNLESEVEPTKCCEVEKFSQKDNKNSEPRNRKRMRQSKSLENNSVKPVQVQEKIDERRQPVRFKAEKEVPTDNLLEISGTVGHLTDKPTQYQNKVDEKRCHSRRKSTRFKVGEEPTAKSIERSDTLDPTTVKSVPDDKRCHSRRQSTRLEVEEEEPTAMVESSYTLDPTINELVRAEKRTDDKRLCSRRQSAKFRHQEQVQEPTVDLSEIDDVKVTVSHLHECDPASSVRTKFETTDCVSVSEDSESRRTSIRPKRQAAEKVQSYKEIPVNIKMRRLQ